MVVRYGMRQALACQADFWRHAAGLSCLTTTAGSWFQSPTVLAANELRSPDEDAPIALNAWTLTDPRGGMNPILHYHFYDGLRVDRRSCPIIIDFWNLTEWPHSLIITTTTKMSEL